MKNYKAIGQRYEMTDSMCSILDSFPHDVETLLIKSPHKIETIKRLCKHKKWGIDYKEKFFLTRLDVLMLREEYKIEIEIPEKEIKNERTRND